jgi:hypothetical protein
MCIQVTLLEFLWTSFIPQALYTDTQHYEADGYTLNLNIVTILV